MRTKGVLSIAVLKRRYRTEPVQIGTPGLGSMERNVTFLELVRGVAL
jgi:hypothetical protein